MYVPVLHCAQKCIMSVNMTASHHRHDISDQVWRISAPLRPGPSEADRSGTITGFSTACGGFCAPVCRGETSHRTMATGRTLITAAPTDGTGTCGPQQLSAVSNAPDMSPRIRDASHIKVHPLAAVQRNQAWPVPKGLNSQLPLAVDVQGQPVPMRVTVGTVTQALLLLENLPMAGL